jgi:hypothetical protein
MLTGINDKLAHSHRVCAAAGNSYQAPNENYQQPAKKYRAKLPTKLEELYI